MTEAQAARIIELLEALNSKIDGLTGPQTTWDPEQKKNIPNPDYLSLNVDVMNEVEVTGSVTTYDPR